MHHTREDVIRMGLMPCPLQPSQHRRANWADYAGPGLYMVTLCVDGRVPLFGHLEGDIRAPRSSNAFPHLVPSTLGRAILDNELPKIHAVYPEVELWQAALMPDHLHLLLYIRRPLPGKKRLGTVIGAFMGGCSRAWWRLSEPAGTPAADAAGTTAEAMIAYVGSASNCTHGLAIALESASDCKWDDRASTLATWAASHSVVNGEWRVPSDADLKYMFEACGGPSSSTPTEDSGYLGNAGPYSYGSLPTMLASLNSSYDIRENACWTNTEASETLAWVYFFNDDADHSGFTVDWKNSSCGLRAILEF